MADRIEALRAALKRVVDVAHPSWRSSAIAADALADDDNAAAAQDEANEQHCVAEAETVYGWQGHGLGFIRALGDRPADPMEPR